MQRNLNLRSLTERKAGSSFKFKFFQVKESGNVIPLGLCHINNRCLTVCCEPYTFQRI